MHTQIQCTTHTIPPISITMYQSARERIPPMAWVCQFRGTSIQSPWCCSFSISPISFHRSRHRPRHLLLARTNCCGSPEHQSTVLSCSAEHAHERGDGLSGGEVFYCPLFLKLFPNFKVQSDSLTLWFDAFVPRSHLGCEPRQGVMSDDEGCRALLLT